MGLTSSTLASEPTIKAPYRPRPKDVLQARFALMHFVPRELADSIIDFAQYWPSVCSNMERKLDMIANSESEAEWSYLITPPILPDSSSLTDADHPTDTTKDGWKDVFDITPKIKRVRFSIVSHDQGWSDSEAQFKNTYKATFSWFEASILRCNPKIPSPLIREMSAAPFNFRQFSAGVLLGELRAPQVVDTPRWLVQKNRHASYVVQQHEVIWTDDDVYGEADHSRLLSTPDSRDAPNELTGSGNGNGFLRELQLGDRVVLWARSRHPGWANHIYSAEVEVSYSV
jgi:hypothetical protein